jgi:heme A synthase
MQPTRARTLVYLAFAGAVFGYFLPRIWDALTGNIMPVPLLAAIVLFVLAGALLWWTLGVRRRLSGKPGVERLDPLLAARTVALAMAASRTGALVAGFYAGVVIYFLPKVSFAPDRYRVFTGSAAVLGAVALLVVALWLEHICRIPEPPADDATTPNGRRPQPS